MVRRKKKRVGHAGREYQMMRSELIERTSHCVLCGGEIDKTAHYLDPLAPQLDYIIPVSRGGRHTRENARILHRGCNSRKWCKMPWEIDNITPEDVNPRYVYGESP